MINNPDYMWYVIRDFKIESGWEFRSDAIDHIIFNGVKGGKVCSLKTLMHRKLYPNIDQNWEGVE